MNYDEVYNFCFPNETILAELYEAHDAKDAHVVTNCVRAQVAEIGSEVRLGAGGGPEIAHDPDIFATRTKDIEMLHIKPDYSTIPSYEEELELIVELSQRRDEQLSSLSDSIPQSLREMSWFLRNRTVAAYAAGQDFGGQAEHERVYSGKQPTGSLTIGSQVPITTGRHVCSLVHSDNPITEAIGVIKDLLSNGVASRNCPSMEDTPGLFRFTAGGPPFLFGAIGECFRRVGLISFREKWQKRKGRPAQDLAKDGRFPLWAFPELHPLHPSRNAMHFISYAVFAAYLKCVFDTLHILPSGNTVEYELDLWRDNFGDGRCWPGVHSRLDHAPYLNRSEAMGKKIAREHFS